MIKECYIRILLQRENEHVILLWTRNMWRGVHYTQPGKNILGGKFIVFQSTYLILNIFHIFHVDTISFFLLRTLFSLLALFYSYLSQFHIFMLHFHMRYRIILTSTIHNIRWCCNLYKIAFLLFYAHMFISIIVHFF